MRICTRRGLLLPLVVALAACSGAGGGGATTPSTGSNQALSTQSTLAAVLDSAPEATGGREVFRKLAIHPDAKLPAILINFVANGPNQAGVPCINCVSGASTGDNIGMTGPSSYVLSNFTWQYELSFTDLTYSGKCKLAWAITSGNKTIDSFSATLHIPSSAQGGFVLFAISRSRPNYSGPATLTGRVTCGKDNPSLQVPLQFE